MFVHLREMRNYLDIFDYTCARSFLLLHTISCFLLMPCDCGHMAACRVFCAFCVSDNILREVIVTKHELSLTTLKIIFFDKKYPVPVPVLLV